MFFLGLSLGATVTGSGPAHPTPASPPSPARGEKNRLTFKLPLGVPAVSAPLSLEGASASHSTMKRSHNYSSSDSDLDDNVEVEKDSGDENGYGSVPRSRVC